MNPIRKPYERRNTMKSSTKHGLVWGGLLILLGVMSLVETFTRLGSWTWITVLTIAGLGVYGLYAQERSEKWMLIVSYVLLAVAGLVMLITLNVLRDEAIATYVLTVIAIPFLVAFLQGDRTKWGLLLPPYILIAVGVMVGLIGVGFLDDLLIPAYVLIAIAIPFFVVYARDTKQWWPLIPGGITAIVGLSFLIAEAAVQFVVPVALIIAGIWVLYRQFSQKET
jgi:hypothetical protein